MSNETMNKGARSEKKEWCHKQINWHWPGSFKGFSHWLQKTHNYMVSKLGQVWSQSHVYIALSCPEPSILRVSEGSSATFTIRRNGSAELPATVKYRTVDALASAIYGDYEAVGEEVVSFAAGESNKTIMVSVLQDSAPEPDEEFYLQLYDATGLSCLAHPALRLVSLTSMALHLSSVIYSLPYYSSPHVM